ncbi:dihydrolipoyl dehydrogenase [Sporosarcina jiandibaonis]|uniref:dihydrolipoyl dehydrogenase n=1 Tax=Sporosarcina jiandibaonis TaxID=2715535 RepID=UPI0015562BE7|nr:dihydrolipoyl dehydrogenase [Sporosarcina jiandibaonis]
MVVGEISQERDLVIIGGGPGGYSAAIRAAQLGLSATLIEQSQLGGVCLNEGCIPSKVFTHAAGKLAEKPHLQDLGISGIDMEFNINQLLAYKTKIIKRLRTGIEKLCKENKIELIYGKATFLDENRIGVENGHQFDIFTCKNTIIATGSSPVMPLEVTIRSTRILLAHEIFNLPEIPDDLLVMGNDYIALEVASCFAALGSHVTIFIENQSGLPFDESINKELLRLFKKRKVSLINKVKLLSTAETEDGITLTVQSDKNREETFAGSYLYVSGERMPNIETTGIARFGIHQNDQGFIKVDENMESSIKSIYAIGDVTEGPRLAAKAIKQGKAAVEVISGGKPEVDLTFLPTIVHTLPPIASVGITEQDVKEHGIDARICEFPMRSNGYAAITANSEGFIKVISDTNTSIVLGIHMIGEGAVELSSSFVQLLEMAAKEEDMKFPSYAHPSYGEGLFEAVEGLVGQAIHMAPID